MVDYVSVHHNNTVLPTIKTGYTGGESYKYESNQMVGGKRKSRGKKRRGSKKMGGKKRRTMRRCF